jgi:DNA-binding LytR/AlgR family response regulator
MSASRIVLRLPGGNFAGVRIKGLDGRLAVHVRDGGFSAACDGSTRIRIEPSDILWVGSAGNYVEYSLVDGRSHLVRGTLAAEEARLARFNIARVHWTRLVNLTRVNGLSLGPNGDFELTLDTGQVVPGSRRYRDAIASIAAANALSATGGSRPHP